MTSSFLMGAFGVLVIAVGVAASIALHEIGHLVPAKKFGIKCTQYMVGFGPTVWSRRVGETEYGVKAIPLGGYVRMLGMFPPKPGHVARADTTGRLALMVEQARNDSFHDIRPEDGDRLFYQRSVPRRVVVMLGGPVMNLVIAIVLLTVVVSGFGMAEQTARISTVSACVLPVGEPDRPCAPGDEAAPAAAAGLLPGDEIVSIAGAAATSWEVVRQGIRDSGGKAIDLVVIRDGQQLTLPVTPIVAEREMIVDNEVVLGDDGAALTESVGFLGVTPTTEMVRQPVTVVPGIMGDALQQVAGVVLRIPEKMVGVAQAAFGDAERDRNGPVSIVGVGRFAGEIGAVEGTEVAPFGFAEKMASWLALLASLNIALFVFNLIPLLPLDGGHVAGALWEGLRRQVARLRSRPDPGPVDVARLLPLTYGVAVVLLSMSVLLIYADVVNPIRLTG